MQAVSIPKGRAMRAQGALLVVTYKPCNDPIRLARMVKKAGQLETNANKPRPHPACLDGESDWQLDRVPRRRPQDPIQVAGRVLARAGPHAL